MSFFNSSYKFAVLYEKLGFNRNWYGIRFICYHSIYDLKTETKDRILNYSISKNEFVEHLNIIDELKMKIVSMDEALALLKKGRIPKGEKYVCFTFDDGYLDNYEIAWPILKQRGYSAHFFVCSGLIGGNHCSLPLMGVDEIKTIIQDGGSVGSHSYNHLILMNQSVGELIKQIKNSKEILEDILDSPINSFAYPNSQYNKQVIEIVGKAGYQFAFSIGLGPVKKLTQLNQFSLPRSVIYGNEKNKNKCIIKGCYDWSHLYFSIKNKYKLTV